MPKRMDPVLPVLSILIQWAMILGTFGGPGRASRPYLSQLLGPMIP